MPKRIFIVGMILHAVYVMYFVIVSIALASVIIANEWKAAFMLLIVVMFSFSLVVFNSVSFYKDIKKWTHEKK